MVLTHCRKCLCVHCYLGLTPDDVGKVKVHRSMCKDSKMKFSACLREYSMLHDTEQASGFICSRLRMAIFYLAICLSMFFLIIMCPSN